MRVLVSTYGSRGDVKPLVGLAVRLRAIGAEVWVCAPDRDGCFSVGEVDEQTLLGRVAGS